MPRPSFFKSKSNVSKTGPATSLVPQAISSTSHRLENQEIGLRLAMAKKTGMSDSSLWILAVVLVAVAAWMYFK
jgi:hypothetical protein